MISRFIITTLYFLLVPTIHTAYALTLGMPVKCDYGKDCFIQNYPDADPSTAYADYQCGKLAYNTHKGVDIRLRHYADMERGFEVIAAATGTVTAVRDGMEDINVNKIGKEKVKQRGCGNGVVLSHADGWQTMYCHLAKGSIRAQKGDIIQKGEYVGLIGLSGMTEFPHLELNVKKNGIAIDPFVGKKVGSGCNQSNKMPLWDSKTQDLLTYIPTALLRQGFADYVPDPEAIRHLKEPQATIAHDARMLIYWVDVMGILPQDQLTMTITSPDGTTINKHTNTIPKNKAQFFQYIGKKNTARTLDPGIYKGHISLLRPQHDHMVEIFSETTTITVEER